MLFCKKNNTGKCFWSPGALISLTVINVVLCFLPVHADPEDQFIIHHARAELRDGTYYTDATLNIHFGKKTLEALDNGITIPIQINIRVIRERRWWFAKTVIEQSIDYKIQHHALSKSYLVNSKRLGFSRSYNTLEATLLALGSIKDFPLLAQNHLKPGTHYMYIRAQLDIERLPALLRPLTYMRSLWQSDSAWYLWPIQP